MISIRQTLLILPPEVEVPAEEILNLGYYGPPALIVTLEGLVVGSYLKRFEGIISPGDKLAP